VKPQKGGSRRPVAREPAPRKNTGRIDRREVADKCFRGDRRDLGSRRFEQAVQIRGMPVGRLFLAGFSTFYAGFGARYFPL
jgi:hypothetical protein